MIAGTIAAAVLTAGAISASAANTSYTDVKSGAWYAPAVSMASSHGLMSGIGNNQFAPNDSMSRSMVVQVLYNQAGKPKVSGRAAFSDVKQGSWYYDAVQWAAKNNVASGVGDGKFAPNSKVTRQEFAAFLYRYAGSPSVSGSLNFVDGNKASSWAKNALLWANQNGIISGSQDGDKLLLDPTGNATRAQAAQMLVQYLDISDPGHSYTSKVTAEATCTTEGTKTYTCSVCGKTKTETIPATGHTIVTDQAVAPTCTETGKTEGSHCSVCNTVLTAQNTVPATGHNYKSEVTKEPTCDEDGQIKYTCKNCNDTYTETIPKLGHDWQDQLENVWVVDKEAYDEKVIVGYRKYYMCTGCKEKFYFDQYPESDDDTSPGQANASDAVSHHIFDCDSANAGYTYLKESIWETIHHDEVGHYEEQLTGYKCSRCNTTKTVD